MSPSSIYVGLLWTTVCLNVAAVQGQQIADFKKSCIDTHNSFRAKHRAPNVKWSNTLEQEAKHWAAYLAESNNFFRGSKGENIYLSAEVKSFVSAAECKTAVEEFYSEGSKYDYSKAILSRDSERFTQLVWRSVLEIGAAGAKRKDSKIVIVVRYNPPGNYNSTEAFKENVSPRPPPPQDQPGISSAHVKQHIPLSAMMIITLVTKLLIA